MDPANAIITTAPEPRAGVVLDAARDAATIARAAALAAEETAAEALTAYNQAMGHPAP